MDTAARVRRRINELLAEHKGEPDWNQQAVAERAGGRHQSWLSRILAGKLNGGQDVRLEDLDVLAEALHTTAVELVRDHERYEMVADLKPHEMTLLRHFQRLPRAAKDAVLNIVTHMAAPVAPSKGRRHEHTPAREEILTPEVVRLAEELYAEVRAEQQRQAEESREHDPRPPPGPPRPRPSYRSGRR